VAFASGPVTFKRLFVDGQIEEQACEALVEALSRHAIGRDSITEADRTQVGWVTGDHILDTEFDFAKNVVGDCLHFALRIDANKTPMELVRSYQKLNETAALQASGREFLSRDERREARDQARSRADREAAAGMHRRMKQYPVLWDLATNSLYLGASSPTVVDRFSLLFATTFERNLTPAGAGMLASRWASRAGWTSAMSELRPTAFVNPPDGEGIQFDEGTDEARRYDFLGNEWLMWLWFTTHAESAEVVVNPAGDGVTTLFAGSLDLKCPFGLTGSESIKADDPTRLPEAREAIRTGKIPLRAGLHLVRQGEPYLCAIRGDVMHVSGLRLPPLDEVDDRVIFEERIGQLRHFATTLDDLYSVFLKQRLSAQWPARLAAIRAWLGGGHQQPNLKLHSDANEPAGDTVMV
jgi:hypothetical protein